MGLGQNLPPLKTDDGTTLAMIDDRLRAIEEQLRTLNLDLHFKTVIDAIFEVAKTNVKQRLELIQIHEKHILQKLDELFPQDSEPGGEWNESKGKRPF